jgi:hypothetical protein
MEKKMGRKPRIPHAPNLPPTMEIVFKSVEWVNTQLQKHPGMYTGPSNTWGVPDEMLASCKNALFVLDEAALAGDEDETRKAAHEYCAAWRTVFRYVTSGAVKGGGVGF